ncbi:MAG: MCP four helix bundle domain-containing protein, partial [Rhodoferax sp.]
MKVFSLITDWASRLRVVTRLGLGFGTLLLFTLLVGGAGVGGMYRLHEQVNQIVLVNNAKLAYAQAMSRTLNLQEGFYLSLMLAMSAEEHKQINAGIKFQAGAYDDAKSGLKESLTLGKPTDAESAIFTKILENESAAAPVMAKVLKLVEDDSTEAALKVMQAEVKPVVSKWINNLDEMVSVEQRLNDKAASETEKD